MYMYIYMYIYIYTLLIVFDQWNPNAATLKKCVDPKEENKNKK